MLLAHLYAHKQYDIAPQYDLILDEVEDLCLTADSPLNTLMRKSGKFRLSLLLASQRYSCDDDSLGRLIGNCGGHVFFLRRTRISVILQRSPATTEPHSRTWSWVNALPNGVLQPHQEEESQCGLQGNSIPGELLIAIANIAQHRSHFVKGCGHKLPVPHIPSRERK
jgi:hypothetical protein